MSIVPEPKWIERKMPDGVWWTCNECGSVDAHGQRREFKCRTTNPKTFNLCDAGKD